jgi:hypothetical protein
MPARIRRGFIVMRLLPVALGRGLLLLLLLLPAAGCATGTAGGRATTGAGGRAREAPAAASDDELWRDYEVAVEDARYPRPERIVRDLVPITTAFDGLVWDATRQHVLMVTWSRSSKYTHTGPMALPSETWLTAVPFVRRFCQATGLSGKLLDTRLAQRIGLPPNPTYDVFVEMWVAPADIFRPCPDPEIDDRECVVNLTTGTVDRAAPCPWQAARTAQVSGKFTLVSQDHLKWLCDNWTSRYPPGKPRESYPWTALGYTYDWSRSSPGHVGDSEFVAPAGTAVDVKAITKTGEYCAPAG